MMEWGGGPGMSPCGSDCFLLALVGRGFGVLQKPERDEAAR